jgi:hypothetical protein
LFTTRWVHVFEEDTAAGAVFRPEDGAIPLSRRPREQLEFDPDGTARLMKAGPDDRLVEEPATWREGGAGPTAGLADRGTDLRIVDRKPDRLVVKFGR